MIEKLAKKSFDNNIDSGYDNYKTAIANVKREANDINSKLDRIRFYNIHIDLVNEKYNAHLKVCKNPDNCQNNEEYEAIIYFLRQELEENGILFNNDVFTVEEKSGQDERLDKILKEIQELKLGNQIIYDDLLTEISELKEFYFLGKKKWHQLFAGKFVDMAVSGIVSETISKQIIESLKPEFIKLM